jgi:two-component system CheB/CheR fusion protein
MRILVVDDNADVATMLAELLKLDGHEDVAIAGDGVEALEAMRTSTPDFVLCDLVLPGKLDGFALASTCRDDTKLKDVRLVAMSGYGGDEHRARALAAGFDDLLAKPVRCDTLSACITRAGRGA